MDTLDMQIKLFENTTSELGDNFVYPISRAVLLLLLEHLKELQHFRDTQNFKLKERPRQAYIDNQEVVCIADYAWKDNDETLFYFFIEHDCKRFAVPAEWVEFR